MSVSDPKPELDRARVRGVLHGICWVFTILLVGFYSGVDFACAPYRLPPVLEGAQDLFAVLAFVFLLAHVVIRCASVKWALFTLTTLICVTCALGACHFLSIDLAFLSTRGTREEAHVTSAAAARNEAVKPIGIYQFHERYGFDHIPNSEGTHQTPDFEVTYTIDAHRCRVTPEPEAPRGRILITGASFTFGHGVENHECYPSILGREYWPNYKIQNRAVCGYGTAHAYMLVSDMMDGAGGDPPALVIYAMIPGHVVRNYIRRSYVGLILRLPFFVGQSADSRLNRRGYPHFELKDGRLEFCGVIGPENTVEFSPYLHQYELALTEAFLDGIRKKCSQRHVPFAVLILPERQKTNASSIKAVLERLGVPYLDISEMRIETFAQDPHPNPEDHQRIAAAIGRSFVTDMLHSDKQGQK